MAKETGNAFKGQTDAKSVLWRVYLPIAFVASVVIGSMCYIFYLGDGMTSVHAPFIDAALQVEIEVTTAHLWFEEIISGDRSESIDTVLTHLDNADGHIRVMLEGGRNTDWRFSPVDDAEVREQVETMQAKLAEFRAITSDRIDRPADSPVGSEIDRRYDAVFAELLSAANQVEAQIKQMIGRQLAHFRVVQTTLILLCLVVTAFAGIIYGRMMRRQILRGLELQAANQQLDTSNQQLDASNQQLAASEQQLKAANQQLRAEEQQLRASNQQLRDSEDRFRDFFDNVPIGFHIFGPDRIITRINDAELAMTGYARDEIVGKKTLADFIIPDHGDRFEKHWRDIITKGEVRDLEYTLVCKDGHHIDVILNASSRFDKQGNLISTRGSVLDITKRKQAEYELRTANQQLQANEQQLKASNQQLTAGEQQLKATNQQLTSNEQQLRAANQQLTADEQQLRATNQQLIASEEEIRAMAKFPSENPNPVLRLSKDCTVIYRNEASSPIMEAWGWKDGQPLSLPEHEAKLIEIAFDSGELASFDLDLGDRTFSVTLAPVVESGYVNVYALDITARKRAGTQLEKSLEEKEVLLREIHHRVKNNLQIIVSLLSLQSEYIQDERAVELFRESQFRVKSMALLHERLYQTEDLAHMNFSDYVRDLTTELLASYRPDAGKIKLKIDVEDVFPSIDVAVPCGLIINELVSNCLKHAFPGDRSGEIRIEFKSDKRGNCTLSIGDNGVGFAQDAEVPDGRTLGLQLVHTLAAQIEGSVVVDKSAGTLFNISFSRPL